MAPFFDELVEMAQDADLVASDQVIQDPNTGDIRSVFAMHELSDHFSRLTRDPRILGMVRQLLGSEVYIHQSRINDKLGFEGSGFYWHSDFETWHSEDGMPSMRAVSASLMLFESNTLHASNSNMSPWPRSNLFFVYNSVDNLLKEPYAANSPRPEFLGTRKNTAPLTMHDDFPELA